MEIFGSIDSCFNTEKKACWKKTAGLHTKKTAGLNNEKENCWKKTAGLYQCNHYSIIQCSRQAMFDGFQKCIPGLSTWMESCYSGQPLLYMGSEIIHSFCGVQQGDPLGTLEFAVMLQLLIELFHDEVSSLNLNAWYLDDDTLVGSEEDLAAALRIVELTSPSLGIHLNGGKSLYTYLRVMPLPVTNLQTFQSLAGAFPCWVSWTPSYCEEFL